PLLTTELTIDKFTFEKLPTQSITTATSTDKGFRGLVTGYIRTSGNVRNLDEFSAEAQFLVLELQVPGITVLRSPEPVTLRLEKGRLQVQQMSFVDESAFSTFTIDGTLNVADLTGPQPLDFTVNGRLDARLAGLFLEDFYFDGQNDLSLQIKGNLQKPGITGSLDMHNFELNVPGEKIFINRVNGKILFQDNRITVGPLSGKLNDGSLDVEGEIITGAGGFQEMNINVTTARNHFEFPKGLFSEASAKLNFSFIDQEYLLSGTVEIDEGIYKEPFNILNKIFNYLGSSRIQEISQQGTFSERLNLDIEVHTISPIYVDTNFSRSEITTDLSIGGTLARPNLSGRVMMKEGGEIYLGKNRFVVESGIINFVNPYRIDPEFNIRARSKVNNYDILLSITGTLSTLAVNVNSTPPLPQPGIIGLLIGNGGTGTGENATFLDFVGSRALGYLSSAIFGSVEKLFQGTLGIETFRLDGSLIASKDNPGARLTVGHHLTPNLELILSQSLTKAQNRTWILDYKPLPNFSIEARKQDKENYTASLLGEIYFGYRGETAETIEPGKRTAKPLKISDVQIQGNTVLPLSLIYKNLKLRKGKKFNFFKYRDDLERLRKLYRENQFLRADIDNEHIEQDNQVIIRYTIEAGPRVYLDFYGTNLPPFLKKMINSWYREQFGLQSTRYVEQEIYLQLYKKGYYQAQVRTGDPIEGDNFIRFPFYIETGIKYNKAHFLFTGNNQVPDKTLYRFLKNAKLRTLTFHDPKQVVEELTNYYQEKGFLEVKIRLLENSYIPRSQKAEVEFLIIEGPRARIGQITFTGNRVLSDSELLKAIKLKKNHIFSPVKLDDAGYEIANAYAKKGFNNVQLTNTRQYVSKIGVMNLEFQVEENQRGIIREITITGNSLTKPQTIRRELTFKEGDILDFNEINKSRMKLYELEIFEWIDIETQPLDEELPGNEKPFRIVINLREMRPYRVKGGLQWDMDKKLGGIFEFSTPNIAGKAHYLGTSIILDQKENGFKAYYRLPYLFKQKIGTEFFVFAGKKKEPSFTISRKGFTVQQQLKYWRRLLVSLSYTFERDHIVKPAILSIPALMSAPGPALDTRFNLGYLTAALTYDRRNNIIDPTRGFFLSGSWLYVQKFLGAQVNFYRFYIEGQLYLPVTRFLVIASSLKAGSGRGLGKEFLPGERFFAGGGNTLRGFKESMVGPLDANGNPLGGEALFLFNEELRIRLNKMFILVLFADLGNVYAAAKEFNIFNVRKSIGFGLRVYVGPLLLRGDIGFILNRRPGEPTSAIILSIGQTF
ncbi:MAG: translocation/assembly module TamB domain-containing protein, partial [Acidobacteria bacterium]|nr:translocation/assembly module TamB domain-containing protein [Acidobacteriota bacterium]